MSCGLNDRDGLAPSIRSHRSSRSLLRLSGGAPQHQRHSLHGGMANGELEQEIANLKTELELRRTLAGNSAMTIVQRHGTRAAGSRGILEGDTTRDRLKEGQEAQSTP